MQQPNTQSSDDALKSKLAQRAANALGLSLDAAMDLSVATLVTILEEYAAYQRREERVQALEARAIREGIFDRGTLDKMSTEARTEAHAALRILEELECLEPPRTVRVHDARALATPAGAWPEGLVDLVSRLVAVVASQEESLSLLRTELGDLKAASTVDALTPPLPLLPRIVADGDSEATPADDAASAPPMVPSGLLDAGAPPSVHSRQTLSSELAPYGGNRRAVAEIEGIVSYIAALGADRNLPLGALHERARTMSQADRRARTRAFQRSR